MALEAQKKSANLVNDSANNRPHGQSLNHEIRLRPSAVPLASLPQLDSAEKLLPDDLPADLLDRLRPERSVLLKLGLPAFRNFVLEVTFHVKKPGGSK
ncbi:MAG: hypothetical protein ACLQU1_21510 [Bryobacteraceae bacterium]